MINQRFLLTILNSAPLILFGLILIILSLLSDSFLSFANFRNIVNQAAPVAVMAIGMTFVLLVKGVDLSIGSVMYLVAVVMGLFLPGLPVVVVIPTILLIGLVFGVINAVFVTLFKIAPFIVTLATLFIIRGLALFLSGTRMVFQSDTIQTMGRSALLGVPYAIWILIVIAAIGWVVLSQTPYGRQIYAIGADAHAAEKAGIPVRRIVFSVFCICGVCAAIGAFISVSQIGAASATFGYQKEFPVIAAAVLGGTSLFGGRGGVFGSIFGSVLVQTTENGLVMLNADPYLYPLVAALIIFLAAWVDGRRTAITERLERRKIRVE